MSLKNLDVGIILSLISLCIGLGPMITQLISDVISYNTPIPETCQIPSQELKYGNLLAYTPEKGLFEVNNSSSDPRPYFGQGAILMNLSENEQTFDIEYKIDNAIDHNDDNGNQEIKILVNTEHLEERRIEGYQSRNSVTLNSIRIDKDSIVPILFLFQEREKLSSSPPKISNGSNRGEPIKPITQIIEDLREFSATWIRLTFAVLVVLLVCFLLIIIVIYKNSRLRIISTG